MSKRAQRHIRTICRHLQEGLTQGEQDNDPDAEDMYHSDLMDWQVISRLMAEGNKNRALDKYDHLDTASREYIFEFLNDDDANYMNRFFGWAE